MFLKNLSNNRLKTQINNPAIPPRKKVVNPIVRIPANKTNIIFASLK
jgi:hypothetical protein